MTTDQILLGAGLILVLAVGSQVLARLMHVPALILLLPAGFIAGALTSDVNPQRLLGPAFQPLVSLAVALILYDSGMGLEWGKVRGRARRVVPRLVLIGVPITLVFGAVFAALLLGMSRGAAVMIGAILVVSGPTVVNPLLAFIQPVDRLRRILSWEGSLIDPVGGILGAVVFHAVVAGSGRRVSQSLVHFLGSFGLGLAGAAVGTAVLWFCLRRLDLDEVLGTSCQLATVVGVAAACDAIRDDTGLVAAVLMGLAVANIPGFDMPARRPFFETLIQLIIGVLFVSISATVTPESLRHLVLPTVGLVAVLVLLARPLVALIGTINTDLVVGERRFIGWMAPRGIVAAATASTFGAELAGAHIAGASKILPVTFLVIVATVAVYGLTAAPAARLLHVTRPARTRPLLVGGDPWVLDLARAFRSAGLEVVMWAASDDERARINRDSFELAPDDLLASATGERGAVEGVDAVLLLTEEDDFNALAAVALADNPDTTVYRLAPSHARHGVVAPYMAGETLFAADLTRPALAARFSAGERIATAPVNGGRSPGQDVLFLINPHGTLVPVTSARPANPQPGDTLVFLSAGGQAS